MKKPNKTFEKKYISSLVVAAFMLLSVLTAYNINISNRESEPEDSEVQETLNQDTEERLSENESLGQDDGQDEVDSQEENEDESQISSQSQKGQESQTRNDEESSNQDETKKVTEKYTYQGEKTLEWPVMGNIILPYSMDTTVYYTTLDQYACNDGILIDAKIGDKVVAAADGRVVNVADSDRYGTTVTMLIGEYYEVYYSQIDHVKCEIGDEIKAGEVIGQVAKPTRSFILEGPHLFFKMTYQGETVNPSDYLK